LIAVSLLAMLPIGCLTVDADECWVNTSGGLGGSKPIPIGSGVGATSGGNGDTPSGGSSDTPSGGTSNPCTAEPAPSTPDKSGSATSTCEVPSPAGEGATSWSCSDACSSKCPAPGRGTFVSFTSLEFPFVTTIPDDGTDKGGGYQEAKVNLEFVNIHIPTSIVSWWCPFTIGMPLRTAGMGKVSATLAASLSGEITVGVARDMDFDLPQGIFCFQFVDKVNTAFTLKYPSLKASAVRK
jgi:hypothetical protein